MLKSHLYKKSRGLCCNSIIVAPGYFERNLLHILFKKAYDWYKEGVTIYDGNSSCL